MIFPSISFLIYSLWWNLTFMKDIIFYICMFLSCSKEVPNLLSCFMPHHLKVAFLIHIYLCCFDNTCMCMCMTTLYSCCQMSSLLVLREKSSISLRLVSYFVFLLYVCCEIQTLSDKFFFRSFGGHCIKSCDHVDNILLLHSTVCLHYVYLDWHIKSSIWF